MPVFEIDPTLRASADYLRRYKREAKSIYDRTIPPDARARRDYTAKVSVPATERYLRASFSDADMALGHVNYIEYLCQTYATHGVYVITPDIIWQAVLCEIAAAVRAAPDTYASLFTTTPGEQQEIVVTTGSVEDLPLDAIASELHKRVPIRADHFLPAFTTTDPLAGLARLAAFADICSPYYRYGTMLCGFRAVDVRGTPADYAKILDNASHLALEIAIGGDTEISFYLSGKIMPLMMRFIAALEAGDAKFFGSILKTRNCGSGGEIEVSGWWAREMYIKNYEGKKPENTPSHIARVCWKNLETKRQFSLNFGLFYSDVENEVHVPRWGWVQNEIVEAQAGEPIEVDANGIPKIEMRTLRVYAKERKIDAKYLSDGPVLAGYKGREGPAEMIVNAPFIPLQAKTEGN